MTVKRTNVNDLMDSRAPAVVAVVITTGPAPGLEATLTSLVEQDYDALSILVLANDAGEDIAARVAERAPQAFVKVLEENRGFAAACNEGALSVQGADFMLFCHDDIRADPALVTELVAAAYRTNAGIVTPKVVDYLDRMTLLHVGQVVDRFGAVSERVELGEIDHGQQDLERDVFVAPGGATLVRVDLFETLRGFDPLITGLGEDLDLCWRAQIAGARVVVAPAAVLAHRQTIASDEREISSLGTKTSSRQSLQRRHQLATVMTCWSRRSLLGVVPVLILLDVVELIIAIVGRDGDRVAAIVGSWRWVFRRRRNILTRRSEVRAQRVLSDDEIRRLQVGGASRARVFLAALFQDGYDSARGILAPEVLREIGPDEGVGFGAAFSEEESFDEIPNFDGMDSTRLLRILTSFRSQVVAASMLALAWFFGVRNLIGSHLPIVGRLAPLDSWWSTWRHFFASWSPNGVGTGAPGMPGYGVLAFFGTFVFGRMGALPRAALIFAVPLGAWGVWQLLRGVVSNRARLLGAGSYLAFPVGINLISRGRIDVLVVVALLPFTLRHLLTLLNVPGFRPAPYPLPVRFGRRTWSSTRSGRSALVMIQVAAMTAMAPATLIVIILLVIGLVVSTRLLVDEATSLDRPWQELGRLVVGVALLLLPMTCDTFLAGRRGLEVFGLAQAPWSGLGFGHLLRGANGPYGMSWSGWMLPCAALASVAIARGTRRRLATSFLTVMSLTLFVATLVGRHWSGRFAPDVDVLLVLVAVSIAVLVAVSVNAIEVDLREVNFGWHQLLAAVAVLFLVGSFGTFLGHSSSGRFALPLTGAPEAMGSLAPATLGGYRILWLGNPAVLPLAGWSIAPGLAGATSTNGVPSGSELFAPPVTGAADDLLNAVHSAVVGGTVHLGQLLAPSGVASIVVMNAAAPTIEGFQSSTSTPTPSALVTSLERQSDLALIAQTGGVYVFQNLRFHGILASRAAPVGAGESTSSSDSVADWHPVLDFGYRSGSLPGGTVVAGMSPATAFALHVKGVAVPRSGRLGWAATYETSPGVGSLVLHQFPLNGLLALVTLGLWVSFASGFGTIEMYEIVTGGRRKRGRPATSSVEVE